MNLLKLLLMIVAIVALLCGFIRYPEVQSRSDGAPLAVMTFNVGTFNGKPADIQHVARIAAKPEAPDFL